MLGDTQTVRGTAKKWNGFLLEPFDQGDWNEGIGRVMKEIPESSQGICKSLAMNWVAHHATEQTGSFAVLARSSGRGSRRGGGNYTGVSMALNQVAYGEALDSATSPCRYEQAKDKFTDDFLRKKGIIRQMKITNPVENLSRAEIKKTPTTLGADIKFAKSLAASVVGVHAKNYWSYKIISLHGCAGGHAVAAFIGADAVFFDPNYGIFYFEKVNDFKDWLGLPGGFYWTSKYFEYLGSDFVIKSYAPEVKFKASRVA
ncbi:YopT-type cysteine protease domain-containing protein [Pelagibius sp. Alg239-R121]|uniref:YopT-type cysteine protease domain-containing protein n=1 Tax=Pelagibius sp. Alg239-R121 TaxID=2993448 RepID=UPI0024A6710D|nr:YopT-type cysteine protease domain-containing protein [Pelagibius sp. Alg239-R121]